MLTSLLIFFKSMQWQSAGQQAKENPSEGQ